MRWRVCCTAGARCSTRCRTLSATTRFRPCWCATRAEDALVTEVFINLNFKFRRSNHSGGTQMVIVGDGAARKVFPPGKPAGLAGRHGHDYFCRADRDREDEEKHPKNLYSAFRVFSNLSDEAKPLISYRRFTPCIRFDGTEGTCRSGMSSYLFRCGCMPRLRG